MEELLTGANVTDPVSAQLQDLVRELADSTQPNVWETLRELGFGIDPGVGHRLSFSQVSWVLKQRSGLPITLAIVLIEFARRTGNQAHGLNAPGHFLVQVNGVVVDPAAMRPIEPKPGAALPEASNVDITLRMLNNVKLLLAQSQRQDEALAVIDCQLAVVAALQAHSLRDQLRFEQGEYWRALGVPEMARQSYELAAQGGDADLLARIEPRLEGLSARPRSTLH